MQFVQKCTVALSFSSLINTYQTVTETPKSISGVKKKNNNEKKKKRCQRAAPHSQSSATDFFSTGITDFANYSLRKYPLYDLMR